MRMVTVREDEKGLKMEGVQIDNTVGGRCGIYKHTMEYYSALKEIRQSLDEDEP